jgi:hypothetical protein
VVSYATFAAGAPPPEGSFFGVVRGGSGRALCTNPVQPGGGEFPLVSYVPTEGTVDGALPDGISTPFVRFDGAVTAACARDGGADYLRITPQDARGVAMVSIASRLGPVWGLHLLDVNLALGDLVALAAVQAQAFAS